MSDHALPASLLSRRLAGVPAGERYAVVLEIVRGETADLIGKGIENVDPDRAYQDYGYNSLAAVELTRMLSEVSGFELPLTLLFDYPTPAAVAGHLLARFDPSSVADDAGAPPRARAEHDDPIVVVGMACRYPGGAHSAEQLWQLVHAGVDAVTGFPADRGWDVEAIYHPDQDHPGTSYARSGGFLQGAAEFDAGFFGIGPREALAMDPQQRQLLEGVWEAFEDAGIDPVSLRGSDTGVFVGACDSDYRHLARSSRDELEGYWAVGSAGSVLSGRVAYTFGLVGPAVTVDTACSSSLVATHLAMQSLRRGESSLALAAGVTVYATPALFVEFSRQRAMSPDGRCRSFAEDADGAGWSEGVGVLVLERLSDARRNHHRVLAVLRGSAVNQDGASNGLTAPNGPSQERVIRAALTDAGLSGTDVDAVEAHGTGTTLGDPIEAQALMATYGRGRAETPLWLGSIKSNIGHSQAAAGAAGLIKMIMSIRHGILPRTLHADAPTAEVDWAESGVRLLTEARAWPDNGRPRRGGVSAFGIGGTNAHVIVEQAPAGEDATEPVPDPAAPSLFVSGPVVWVLSAKSRAALTGQARRLRAWILADPERDPVDIAYSLIATRARWEYRAVVVGRTRESLLAGLDAVIDGSHEDRADLRIASGRAGRIERVAYAFPGQGPQWPGMAVELLDSSPVFAARMAECEQALAPHLDWSLTDVLRDNEGAPSLDRVDVVQPVLFSVMVSLAALWEALGVRPDGVVGHSQGEVAAACVAGRISLADGARVVAVRSRLVRDLVVAVGGGGRMMSVAEPVERVRERLRRWPGQAWVAAVNGPAMVTLSGAGQTLTEVYDSCVADGVWVRWVPVDYASHSPQVDPVREPLLAELGELRIEDGPVRFHSTVPGAPAESTSDYWFRNMREPVLFDPAVRGMLAEGYRAFVEMSPHTALTVPLEQSVGAAGVDPGEVCAVGSLRHDDGSPDRFLLSVAEAFVAGVDVDWRALFAGRDARPVALPSYAFEHERFWAVAERHVRSAGLSSAEHPLLSGVVHMADGSGWLFTGSWSAERHPWLLDHLVFGRVVVSGTTLVEAAAAAGARAGCPVVAELVLESPLIVPDGAEVAIQVRVGEPDDEGRSRCTVYSDTAVDAGGAWVCHASGTLVAESDAVAPYSVSSPPADAREVDVADAYAALEERGFGYGLAFRGMCAVQRRGEEIYAEVRMPQSGSGFLLHPGALDAAFHAALLGDGASAPQGVVLPFVWSGVRFVRRPGTGVLRVHLTPTGPDAVGMVGIDEAGDVVVSVDSVVSRPVSPDHLGPARSRNDALFTLGWPEIAASPMGTPRRLVLLGPEIEADPRDRDVRRFRDVPDLVAALDGGAVAPDVALVRITAPQDTDVAGAAHATTRRALDLVQRWLSAPGLATTRLVVVTEHAVAVDADAAVALPVAPVWGLLRSAQTEHPDRIVIADLDTEHRADPGRWWHELDLAIGAGAPQIAVRDGRLRVPRLEPVSRTGRSAGLDLRADCFDAEATVLVTGGTSGLGALTARHLVTEHGVRHLVLASRSGPAAEGIDELVRELTESGAGVRVTACDVTDPAAVSTLIAGIGPEHPLRVVVHSAGVLADGVIEAMLPEQLDRVLAAKVDAAWNLHRATRHLELSGFVLFSSASGLLGGAGQANYAAANVFLDALAHFRRAAGLPGISLAWGYWAPTTSLTRELRELDVARLGESGVVAMSAEEGLALFDAALAGRDPVVFPVRLDRAALRSQARAGRLDPVLDGLVTSGRDAATADPAAELRKTLAALGAQEREHHLLQVVREAVATVLHHRTPQAVAPDRAFKELGFDSLAAVQLRNRLSRATGLTLAPTIVFDHPTPHAITACLLDRLFPARAESGPVAAPVMPAEHAEELAGIDGMDAEALVQLALRGDRQ
ncbi:type I polyketide synthase [Nocardia shimofusensis]|nr:type I polyketide synthase [Nocardia shimofusensis]